MTHSPSRTPTLLGLLAALGTLAFSSTTATALAASPKRHVKRAKHHVRNSVKMHHAVGHIRPGGDRDVDNSGGPSDGDGNL
jgi:hypothetical protein